LKIIISHDVDHLYPSDHILRDIFFPKLWVRSTIELLKGTIGVKTWIYRLNSVFYKRLNQIPEIIEFDKKYNIPSIFFFGMRQKLGMSYKKNAAVQWIRYVLKNGSEVGVHGVEIDDINEMQAEYNDFRDISGQRSFGIRTHYVRYNDSSFAKMASIGYFFDSSEYNKGEIIFKAPYKIANMWEFPLYIMDKDIIMDNLETAKNKTIEALTNAENCGLKFFTFLFHDYFFNERSFPELKSYYEWFVDYCCNQNLVFTSYSRAIMELEGK
jgi:hypothetical protein